MSALFYINHKGNQEKFNSFRDSTFSETGHRTALVERSSEYLSISIINHCQTTSMRVGVGSQEQTLTGRVWSTPGENSLDTGICIARAFNP